MKKIIKMLSTATIALCAFISAGCSCGLKEEEIKSKTGALNTSNVFANGDSMQDFDYTYIYHNLDDGTSVKTVYNTNINLNNTYTVTVFENDTETSSQTVQGAKVAIKADSGVLTQYDVFKTQPLVAYEINKKQSAKENVEYAEFRKLYGLSSASDSYLANLEVKFDAEKPLFGKEAIFVIEYHIDVIQRYRITIKVNKQNKITSATLDLVGDYQINHKGDREERSYNIISITINYK